MSDATSTISNISSGCLSIPTISTLSSHLRATTQSVLANPRSSSLPPPDPLRASNYNLRSMTSMLPFPFDTLSMGTFIGNQCTFSLYIHSTHSLYSVTHFIDFVDVQEIIVCPLPMATPITTRPLLQRRRADRLGSRWRCPSLMWICLRFQR